MTSTGLPAFRHRLQSSGQRRAGTVVALHKTSCGVKSPICHDQQLSGLCGFQSCRHRDQPSAHCPRAVSSFSLANAWFSTPACFRTDADGSAGSTRRASAARPTATARKHWHTFPGPTPGLATRAASAHRRVASRLQTPRHLPQFTKQRACPERIVNVLTCAGGARLTAGGSCALELDVCATLPRRQTAAQMKDGICHRLDSLAHGQPSARSRRSAGARHDRRVCAKLPGIADQALEKRWQRLPTRALTSAGQSAAEPPVCRTRPRCVIMALIGGEGMCICSLSGPFRRPRTWRPVGRARLTSLPRGHRCRAGCARFTHQERVQACGSGFAARRAAEAVRVCAEAAGVLNQALAKEKDDTARGQWADGLVGWRRIEPAKGRSAVDRGISGTSLRRRFYGGRRRCPRAVDRRTEAVAERWSPSRSFGC